jgi:cytochrome oxidase Cu insertion factor (SCO1/SenC/PrrC family)
MRRALRRGGAVLAIVLASATTVPAQAPPPALLEALGLARPTQRLEAPPFTLPGLDGKGARLADLRGRVVLLYFWTTW